MDRAITRDGHVWPAHAVPFSNSWRGIDPELQIPDTPCKQLLERGDRVTATLRRPERLDELKTRYGDRLWVAGMDVTDTAAIRATTGRAFAELGRPGSGTVWHRHHAHRARTHRHQLRCRPGQPRADGGLRRDPSRRCASRLGQWHVRQVQRW